MKHILFFILVLFVSISFYGIDEILPESDSQTSTVHLLKELSESNAEGDQDEVYETYQNGRFGFCAEYPVEFLFPEPPPDNGDGLKFMSKDRQSYMIAAGRYKIDDSLESMYKESLEEVDFFGKKRTITYHRMGKDFFIVSGFQEGKIYYTRKYLRDGVFENLYFVYPPSEKERFDKIITHVTRSFPDCK